MLLTSSALAPSPHRYGSRLKGLVAATHMPGCVGESWHSWQPFLSPSPFHGDHHRLLQVVSVRSSLPVLCSASDTNGIPTAAGAGPEHLPRAHHSGSREHDRQILEQYLVEVCSVCFLIHSKK